MSDTVTYKPRTDHNIVALIGRVIRSTYRNGNGSTVLRFTVANSEARRKKGSEERTEQTTYVNCVTFGDSADNLHRMFGDLSVKGSRKPRVSIQGRLQATLPQKVTIHRDSGDVEVENFTQLEVNCPPFGVQMLDSRPQGQAAEGEAKPATDENGEEIPF